MPASPHVVPDAQSARASRPTMIVHYLTLAFGLVAGGCIGGLIIVAMAAPADLRLRICLTLLYAGLCAFPVAMFFAALGAGHKIRMALWLAIGIMLFTVALAGLIDLYAYA
jgi:hypothetical protein